MSVACRLIIDDPAPGAWNMAVDEALVESAANGGQATLRVYRWMEPTLSLGYFQAYADRQSHPASRDLPCVRRSTGGGALVHHHEVTYSLVLPAGALAGVDTRELYCRAHRAVIAAIGDLDGDPDRLTLCDPDVGAPPTEPFLCFQRRADGDLLVGDPHPEAIDAPPVNGRYKVCGSAQRKRRGALLQHGGLLLAKSGHAPELPGLAELGVAALDPAEASEALARQLATGLGLTPTRGGLTASETEAAKQFASNKHESEEWLKKR